LSRYGLHSILADCEARDHFERSAALAVFHGELGSAFSALQRGAEVLKESLIEDKHIRSPVEVAVLSQYVEILQLVLCVLLDIMDQNTEMTPMQMYGVIPAKVSSNVQNYQ